MIYVETLKEALTLLDIALDQAKQELPPWIHSEHHIASKGHPDAWNVVYHMHINELAERPERVVALFALKAATEARTAVWAAIDEAENIGREIQLPKLSRMR